MAPTGKIDERQNVDRFDVINQIVSLIAQELTVDRRRRNVRLYKDINECQTFEAESIASYIERVSGTTISYPNFTNADENSSESQNFSIVLIINVCVQIKTLVISLAN